LARKLRAQFYTKKVDQLHNTDQHSWWKRVRAFLNIKPKPTYSHLDAPGNKSSPDAINDFFVSVAEDLEPINSDLLPILTPDYCSEYIIDVHQVTKRLLNINVHKAAGPDFIPSWILRDFATFIAELLTAVFNASVREGTVCYS